MDQFPTVALLGPRQVGKTTLAKAIAAQRSSIYLDLETPAKSRLPQSSSLIRLYLAFRPAQWILGKQFLVIGERVD